MKRPTAYLPWFRRLHACACGRRAVWRYVPSDGDEAKRYLCDGCVPRGCSCQLGDDGQPLRDARGRLLPCSEWEFAARGFVLVIAGGPAWRAMSAWQRRRWDVVHWDRAPDRRRKRRELRRQAIAGGAA